MEVVEGYTLQTVHVMAMPLSSYSHFHQPKPYAPSSANILSNGELIIDLGRNEVKKSQKDILLTPKEYDLIEYFMRHQDVVLSQSKILSDVWGEEYQADKILLQKYIRLLRNKVEDDAACPLYILTEQEQGYIMKRITVSDKSMTQVA